MANRPTTKLLGVLNEVLTFPDRKLCERRNPFLWTGLATNTLILNIIALQGIKIYSVPVISMIILPSWLLVVSIKALVYNFLYYPINERFLARVVSSYLAILVIFGNIYFSLVVVFGTQEFPFVGIHSPWTSLDPDQRVLAPLDALISYIDCLHYSCVTITTLGYGDMHATAWYSKLLTDVEVLLGLAVSIIAIGRYFSAACKPTKDAANVTSTPQDII